MKKLLIGLLVLGSFSTFAQTCDESIDLLVSVSNSQGGSEALLVINNANAEKFQVFKRTLETYPQAQEIGGYSRESLEVAIQENNESIARLKSNIKKTKELVVTLKQGIKDTCN
ncbi:MAG: hypothetical protein ACLGG0_06090 [Bacteriovoracia bacterium]